MKRTIAVVLFSGLLLQGCAFAPGQHMTLGSIEENSPEAGEVRLVNITQQTLQQQRDTRTLTVLPAELMNYHPTDYLIGPGDSLFITVWEHPELTSPGSQDQLEANGREVRSDGTLYYPYLGAVQAAGMSVGQLRKNIQQKLSQYVTDAKVDVNVLRYGSQRVILSGSFKNAGSVPLTNTPLTMVQAISQAGMDNGAANMAGLTLKRDGKEYLIDVDALNRRDSLLGELYLKDGDQLHLSNTSPNNIYVLGEVVSPQVMTYGTTSLTLMQALGNAGGLSQDSADGDAVYVIRGAESIDLQPATVFHLNAKKPSAFLLARQFELQAQDVIFVGPANITRWNRFISQLLPSATAVIGTGVAFSN